MRHIPKHNIIESSKPLLKVAYIRFIANKFRYSLRGILINPEIIRLSSGSLRLESLLRNWVAFWEEFLLLTIGLESTKG
jgi:hypothetical protein